MVEDNAFSIGNFVEFLESLEVYYVLANGGQEAIEFVAQSLAEGLLFDCIFVKLQMQLECGYQVAKEIRATEMCFELNQGER